MGLFNRKKKPMVGNEIRKNPEFASAKERDLFLNNDWGAGEVKIGAKPTPILTLKKRTETVDGEKPVVEYEVHKRNSDVIRFSQVELFALFTEIVNKFEAQQILHLLYLAHKEQHDEQDKEGKEFLNGLMDLMGGDDFLKDILKDILKKRG